MTSRIKVFLADDHVCVRDGIKALINEQPDMDVIAEAEDGASAISLCKKLHPDVIVLDISMPGMNGVKVASQLKQVSPRSRTLILTIHDSTAYLRQMLEAGAAGYLVKRATTEELIHAIRSVAKGGTYIDPMLAEKLAAPLRKKGADRDAKIADSELSEREEEVLRLTAQGYSSKEIAEQLNVGRKSVETYKLRAMEKLGLESRTEIVRHAVARGWLHDI
ncbi:MAG: response regulator transcription factor [Candidatus Melainabacteria bacterium]|jgi:DNA-binding NarL/FixJ family response regulator|nr:response regulator transcription factor [Candidatus Melainabacteria bacterium]